MNTLKRPLFSILISTWVAIVAAGCAHYPVNQPLKQVDPQSGYRGKYMGTPGNSENLLLYLTFSGGGTRAAALSYGVLEELRVENRGHIFKSQFSIDSTVVT